MMLRLEAKYGRSTTKFVAIIVVTCAIALLELTHHYSAPSGHHSGTLVDTSAGTTIKKVTSDDGRRQSLRVHSASRVLYNRVPKCGSEAVLYVLQELASRNKFRFVRAQQYLEYNLTVTEQKSLVEEVMSHPLPMVYARHVYFLDFQRFHVKQPIYINVVREPLERLVSWYYYIRFNEGHIRVMSDVRRNRSYEDCVEQGLAECVHVRNYFKVIPFFCGHEPFCSRPSPAALARAKSNVDKYYQVVGVADDLSSFFTAIEHMMPAFFTNATNIFHVNSGSLKEVFHTRNKRAPLLSTKLLMKRRLRFDYDFYFFVKQRFYQLLSQLNSNHYRIPK